MENMVPPKSSSLVGVIHGCVKCSANRLPKGNYKAGQNWLKTTISGIHPKACNNQQILHAWNTAELQVEEWESVIVLPGLHPFHSTQPPAQSAWETWQAKKIGSFFAVAEGISFGLQKWAKTTLRVVQVMLLAVREPASLLVWSCHGYMQQ